ncbi:phosphoribosyl-AMP cyclohydrolase [Candidatus Gottesmanbacteria bacterium]|nr:phosphoribosyl-AMP cyclohydrolase [Candidatus Gottesmanbacteria bacterium]
MSVSIDFTKNNGLIPTIIQDNSTGDIFMFGYMNSEALQKSLQTGWVYFWSRSKKKLWMKGEESGNKLKVKGMYSDCDGDVVLVKVELIGTNVCHTGNKSCFYQKIL